MKKYQIFISSTREDLKEERARIRDMIQSMGHFPICFEYMNPGNEEDWNAIKPVIAASDLFIAVVGVRYGPVIEEGPDAGLSYCEREYNYAFKHCVPTLPFLIDYEYLATRPELVADDPDRLESFKTALMTRRLAYWWRQADDLTETAKRIILEKIDEYQPDGYVSAYRGTGQRVFPRR